jgi:transposase-like protein
MAEVNCDDVLSTSSCSSKKGRRLYTIQKKTKVLTRLAESGGNVAKTARECGVLRSCVQDWSKAEDQIKAMKNDKQISTRKRRKSSAIPGSDSEKKSMVSRITNEVMAWVEKKQAEGITVSGRYIKLQARKLFEDMYKDEEGIDCHFSNGWLDRFCKRHNLTSRANFPGTKSSY